MRNKLKMERPQRVVEYFGLTLVVPFDTRFISTDKHGVIVAHSLQPWREVDFFEGEELGEIAKVSIEDGFDWENSLVEYEDKSLD